MTIKSVDDIESIGKSLDSSFDYERFKEFLAYRESSGNYNAATKSRKGDWYLGKYQIGEDEIRSLGFGNIIDENGGYDSKEFRTFFFSHHELQEQIADQHFLQLINHVKNGKLKKTIGKQLTVNGQVVLDETDLSSILFVQHLGGMHGADKFFDDRGYNPSDGNTRLSQYAIYGSFVDDESISPAKASSIARRADNSNNYASVNSYLKSKNMNDFTNDDMFNNRPDYGSEYGYKYSSVVEEFQKEINILRKKEGLEAIKVDGLLGPETYGAGVKAGLEDKLIAAIGVDEGDKSSYLQAANNMDHSFFIDANNRVMFLQNITKNLPTLTNFLKAKEYGMGISYSEELDGLPPVVKIKNGKNDLVKTG